MSHGITQKGDGVPPGLSQISQEGVPWGASEGLGGLWIHYIPLLLNDCSGQFTEKQVTAWRDPFVGSQSLKSKW